jgi:hypothetical protein
MRHSYIVPGLIDGQKTREQAEYRRDHRGEQTVVHEHPWSNNGMPSGKPSCSEECRIYEPGFKTRSVLSDTKEPIEEEE